MSAIQSSVGLVSGIPIQDTVDQLMAIAARPRDQLASRTDGIIAERTAIDTLSALVLGVNAAVNRFEVSSTFESRTATSSDSSVGVSIPAGGAPNVGSYEFTPLSRASSHQLVSGSFTDLQDAIGSGSLTLGFGGHVDKGVRLDEINGGAGFTSGQIKITDREGSSSIIDLRGAQTIDDVLDAINFDLGIEVTASVSGDTIVLDDNTGGSGNFRVSEVSGGTTASSLGLAGLNSAANTLTGSDIFYLGTDTKLSSLNDGLGVQISGTGINDLDITLRDGTQGSIDLAGATTLGDVLDAINNNANFGGNLSAEINAEGNGIDLIDASGGSGDLIVAEVSGSTAADLGILQTVSASTISGSRVISALKDTLVATLNGGQGYTLGDIDITDRSGASATVDLGSEETLEEIIEAINSTAGIDVTARINSSRGGIEIIDTSGGSGNLVIADAVGSTTATDLGIVIDSAASSIDGGLLNRQTSGSQTLLTSLNGGKGIDLADFRVTDASGVSGVVDLNTPGSEAETLGDVIDKINALTGVDVTASINETGDGILLTDTSGGSGTLTVAEVNGGTAAKDLRLAGSSTTTNGLSQQIINGTSRYTIDLTDLEQTTESLALSSLNGGNGVDLTGFVITDSSGAEQFINLGESGNEASTLGDVIDKINASSIGVTAEFNSSGNGILLTDTAGGVETFKVEDVGSGTSAADLNIAVESSIFDEDNQQIINGVGLFSSTDAEQGGLQTLAERINTLEAGVSAAIFSDSNGFRLSLTAEQTGSANELLIDGSSTGFGFFETSRPKDAVALLGSSGGVGGFAVASETNQFNNVIDGLDITLEQATGEPVTIDVSADDAPLISAAQGFVDAYNALRTNIDEVTDFDSEALTTGILFGRNEVLRVETDLARIITSGFVAPGNLNSLESIGISVDDSGKLSLDTVELTSAFEENPTAVESLLSDDQNGLVTRINEVIDALAGDDNSALSTRSDTLQQTIDVNTERIELWDERLDREREQLLLEFIRLEETIALLQSNNSLIESIQPITIPRSSGN